MTRNRTVAPVTCYFTAANSSEGEAVGGNTGDNEEQEKGKSVKGKDQWWFLLTPVSSKPCEKSVHTPTLLLATIRYSPVKSIPPRPAVL